MKKTVWLFSIVLLSITFTHCKQTGNNASDQQTTTQTAEPRTVDELPKDFLDFYEKFHSDSLYQIDHIVWPLRGIPRIKDQTIEELKEFTWSKDKWVMHHKPDFNHKDYIIQYDLSIPKIITEHIKIRNTDLRMMRRFAKSNNGKWFLIYYSHLNEFNGDKGLTK